MGAEAYMTTTVISFLVNIVLRNSYFLVPANILFTYSGLIDNKTLIAFGFFKNNLKGVQCGLVCSPSIPNNTGLPVNTTILNRGVFHHVKLAY